MTNPLLNKNIIIHDIDFKLINVEHFTEAFEILIPEVHKEHEYLMTQAPLDYQSMFEYAPKQEQLGAVVHIINLLNATVQTPQLKEITEQYLPQISSMYQVMGLDIRGYNRLKAYKLTPEYQNLEDIRKKIIEDILFNYAKSGINLEQEQKSQLEDIAFQLTELSVDFDNNLTETEASLELAFTPEQLEGLPERSLRNAMSQEDQLIVNESSGLYDDILTYCVVEETRKQVYEHRLLVGVEKGFDNRPLVDQILKLKQKKAQILSFDSYANYALVKTMLKSPSEVNDFLDSLGKKAIEAAKIENTQINEEGYKILGREIQFHDRAFVINKIENEKYQVNQETVRQYFPVNHVVQGLFNIIENLYDIKFVANKEKSVWHEDVIVYDVKDNKGDIGSLYLDLYKRKFKSSGAWMDPAVSRHVNKEGVKLPVAYIVCNTPKDTSSVSTFEFEEVVTLFHEMGHALHHLLTQIDIEWYSGINGVQHDAVELPSQFMENFVWDYEIIKVISSHEITQEVLPKDLFDKLYNMKNFLSASMLTRQIILSQLDMVLHSQNDVNAANIEKEIVSKWTARKIDPRSLILPSFSHIFAGGYSAGYYAYKWAEVLSSDAFAALKEAGNTYMEQRDVANKFRQTILAQGGAQDMETNFINFRGRKPEVQYLLQDSGIL